MAVWGYSPGVQHPTGEKRERGELVEERGERERERKVSGGERRGELEIETDRQTDRQTERGRK